MRAVVLAGSCAWSAACVSDQGHVVASWQLVGIDPQGQVSPLPCPQGVANAELHSVAAAPDGTPLQDCTYAGGDCYLDLYDCDAGTGRSSALTAGSYITWIQLASSDGKDVYAVSTRKLVEITTRDQPVDTTLVADGGYFHLVWSLVGQATATPVTCAGTGTSQVTVTTNPGSIATAIDCTAPFGYSAPLPAGTYTVQVAALDAAGHQRGPNVVMLDKVIAGTPNGITELGHVLIPIAGQ
jgi:hypothetical protein